MNECNLAPICCGVPEWRLTNTISNHVFMICESAIMQEHTASEMMLIRYFFKSDQRRLHSEAGASGQLQTGYHLPLPCYARVFRQ